MPGSFFRHLPRRSAQLLLVTSVLVGSLLSAPAASAGDTSAQVINGTAVTPANFAARWQWMTALVGAGQDPYYGQFCGGALIDPQTVITAAHCVYGAETKDPATIEVVVGRRTLSSSAGQKSALTGINVHPAYNPDSTANDVALLRLATPITGITPLTVLGAGEAALWGNGTGLAANKGQAGVTEDEWVADPALGPWIAGWGNRSSTGSSYPDDLYEAAIPLHSDGACSTGGPGLGSGYGGYFESASMFCGGTLDSDGMDGTTNGVDTCQGDSGGPLIVADGAGGWRLAGITSWGAGCATAEYFGVYTRVAALRGWIVDPSSRSRSLTLPAVPGTPTSGQSVSCNPGTWTASAAAIYRYAWRRHNANGTTTTVSASTASPAYAPGTNDVGLRLSCVVAMTDGRARFVAQSAPSSVVAAAPVVNPVVQPVQTGTTVGTAAPTPSTNGTFSTRDTTAPTLRRLGLRCARTACILTLSANDTASGVETVEGRITAIQLRRCRKAGRMRTCSRTTTVRPRSVRAAGDTWRFVLPRVRGTVVVRMVATDRAANSSAALTFRQRIR